MKTMKASSDSKMAVDNISRIDKKKFFASRWVWGALIILVLCAAMAGTARQHFYTPGDIILLSLNVAGHVTAGDGFQTNIAYPFEVQAQGGI